MARTPSTMRMPLGAAAPDFDLPDPTGRRFRLDDFTSSRALLVMFICNHCPFVKHIRDELAAIGRDFADRGLAVVAINSNDVENYPDDSPDQMLREAKEAGYTFPYLFDETQEVAKAYSAACTPDFFLFGPERTLLYRGQLDDSRPGNGVPITGGDLRAAIEAALEGSPISSSQLPSIGCNIKWKPGNEPAYAQ